MMNQSEDIGQSKKNLDEYFAAKPADQLASTLLNKGRSFYNLLESNAYLEKLNNMWRAYHGDYGNDLDYGHRINFTGEQGEFVNLIVNHFRNIAEHILNMVTSNRPVMEARAVNTDYKSMSQAYLANGILDYYMREKGLETCLKDACEMAIVLGSGFIKLAWNATAGETYDADPESGEMAYEGELEFRVLSQFDVVFDGTKETWNNEWIMTRAFENRFNLMAKYPELADKINGIPSKSTSTVYRLGVWSNDDTDDIPTYEFFHKRTEAMPDGRYLLFLSTDCVLLDTKLPYRQLPVFRIAPSNIMGTPYGYTNMFDILPLQEGLNSLYSTVMTNQNAFGVQNLWVPPGSNIQVSALPGAMNVVESEIKPEALQLTQTAPEVFNFINMLVEASETLSGVNSVARGNPESSLKSGTALALVQSMALQFLSGIQNSYVKLIEDTGTAIINILKDFAKTPKIVALVGKNNRTFLKEFTGEEISAINNVVVDVGNPLSRSIAGRVQMAEQLLQMKAIKDPTQYFQVLNTGRLDAMYQGDMSELLLIQSENEKLMEGETPLVSPLDSHKSHILEHRAVLADPELRKDATLIKNTLDHIEMHLNALSETDPRLLQLIGETPLPPLAAAAQGNPSMVPVNQEQLSANEPPPGPGTPPGMPNPNQGQMNTGPLNRSAIPGVIAPQAGMAQPGTPIAGPNQTGVNLPQPARPPKPFANSPTSPKQMLPPIPGGR
jgi:hypothetical protein